MKRSNSLDTRQVEVELILQNWKGAFPESCPKFSAEYYFEDHRGDGVGLVVGKDIVPTGDVNQSILNFLTPIMHYKEVIKSANPIIKVMIFNRAYTCSITISCSALIASIGAELDLRIYPTNDSDLSDH
jgi:hypothetical protein